MNTLAGPKRLAYLETARGIASVIVVLHHFVLGFFPLLKENIMQGGLLMTPLYVVVNGTGAVYFFFLLSGFVLSLKFYRNFSALELSVAVLKRLPRLMLPAGISMMIGAAILIYLPESHSAAARLTGSEWLGTFAGAGIHQDFVPSFWEAARNSLLTFLWPGYSQYNSNLWTMSFEFYGSLLVFAIVAICSLLMRHKYGGIIALHFIISLLCVALHKLLFLPFVIGSLIAFFYVRRPVLFQIPPWAIVMLVLTMIAGYSVDYGPALILASTAAMILLLCIPSLEQRLGGSVGLFLGRLSFPLYLVHVLVILSVTSATYATLTGYGLQHGPVLALSFLITWMFSLLAALPFMTLERVWVPTLNGWTLAFVRHIGMATEINLSKSK
ncbi:Acyltransferase family protein [Agrobacterium sp. DSM 25558]|uniref:acyltransferase family protein n=1 Tax=Agrobacterium sp. DSM 25558 TaxID=1907665 RepID=UPI0009724FE2|nr:acyltransferase [Agrobacterium sp. DSM 25558]SCX14998.1 Acyltransferase family protein [Agrobacterium sp. DSM 25558]